MSDSDNIVELYDHEIQTIQDLTYRIMKKYERRPPTEDNLRELNKEVVGRFQDAGFHVELELLDWLIGEAPAPTISVLSRVEKVEDFDYELKRAEILANREKNGSS